MGMWTITASGLEGIEPLHGINLSNELVNKGTSHKSYDLPLK